MNVREQIEKIMNENENKLYIVENFLHLGSENVVRRALKMLAKNKKIMEAFDGIYVKPYFGKITKSYTKPSINNIALKIAEKNGWKIVPPGYACLNYTGLCTQVPMVVEYETNGEDQVYNYRGRDITFIHSNDKSIFTDSMITNCMIQALKEKGEKNVKEMDINRLKRYCAGYEKEILNNIESANPWIKKVIRNKICNI